MSKTKEMVRDYRKRRAEEAPTNIDETVVERGRELSSLV